MNELKKKMRGRLKGLVLDREQKAALVEQMVTDYIKANAIRVH